MHQQVLAAKTWAKELELQLIKMQIAMDLEHIKMAQLDKILEEYLLDPLAATPSNSTTLKALNKEVQILKEKLKVEESNAQRWV